MPATRLLSLGSGRTVTLFTPCHDQTQRNRSATRAEITKRECPSALLPALVAVRGTSSTLFDETNVPRHIKALWNSNTYGAINVYRQRDTF